MIQVRVDTRELDRLASREIPTRAILQSGTDIFTRAARAEAPSRTGRSRAGILGAIVYSVGGLIGLVYPARKQAWYLRIVATGAKRHEIAPTRFRSARRNRQAARALGPTRGRGAIRALRLRMGGGSYLFRARAQHPGLRANPFLERASRSGESAYVASTEAIIQRALEGGRG